MKYQLVDKFGRIHDYLRISLTDRCNLRCIYCMPTNPVFIPNNNILSNERLVEIAALFVHKFGIKKIRLTGGEPLYRNDCGDIIREISKLPVSLTITTNGILLNKYLQLFKDVGINSINISLDSLKPEVFHFIVKRNLFFQVIQNIHKAIEDGFKIKINVVVIRNVNDNEILDFAKWTLESNIHIRFIEYAPFAGNDWQNDKMVSYIKIKDKIEKSYQLEKLNDDQNSTSKNYKLKDAIGTLAFITMMSEPFCCNCNRLRLSADGKLRNCLFEKAELDLMSSIKSGLPIEQIIQNYIESKKFKLAGISFPTKQNNSYINTNPMVAIGG